MRVLKRVLLGLGVVLVLLVAAFAVLVWTFDANAYREEIAAAVEQRTGRSFSVEGDLALTVYPWLGLAMERARLGNAPGFGDTPMVGVERVHLAVRVWPLFSGEIELGTVTLNGLRLQLQRTADGTTNWQDLTAMTGAGPARVVPAASDSGAGAPPEWLKNARLAGVEVVDAQVIWDDRQADQRMVLDALNLSAEDIRLDQPIPLSADGRVDLSDQLQADFDLDTAVTVAAAMDRATARELVIEADGSGPAIPAGSQSATLMAEVAADLQAATVNVDPLRIEWGPVRADGRIAADAGGATPRARGELEVSEFDPREAFDTLDMEVPETSDGEALRRAVAQLQFAFADGQLAVPEIRVELDESTLTGNAMVAAFSPPDLRFELVLDRLNADRYLPPGAEEEPAPTPGQAAAGAGGSAFEPLRTLRLDGTFDAGSVTVSGAELTDIHAEARARDGVLRVHPLRAGLYGGQYDGDVTVDARGEQPRFKLNEKLTRVQAEPLVQQFAGKDLLSGLGSLSLQLEAAGADLDAWLESATGRGDFRFEDGAVKGVNLAARLRGAAQRLEGKAEPEVDVRETDFTELAGSVTIKDGVVRSDDLAASSPLLRVTGEGKANLREQTVNYLLTVNVVGTLEGQGGDPLEDLTRVPVPVRFKGPLLEPDISLDLKAALTAQQKERLEEKQKEAKQEVQEKRDEAKEELQEKRDETKSEAKEKLEKKLEGFLNR